MVVIEQDFNNGKVAVCNVSFHDTNVEEQRNIALFKNYNDYKDEKIFFYIDNPTDFVHLSRLSNNGEDFSIVSVTDIVDVNDI